MSKPILVIFGITGNQGSATAHALLKYYPDRFHLRGVTRNPGSAESSAWTTKGVEIVRGELGDVDSVRNAVKGAYGVFFLQSWQQQCEKPLETEMSHARTVGEICKDNKIQHFIYSSTSTTQKPGSEHVAIIHTKTLIENMFCNELELPITVLKPTRFMENFLFSPTNYSSLFTIRDGEITNYQPGNVKVPWVACTDIGKAVAVAFVNPKDNIGKHIIVTSDLLSGNQLAEICTKVYGKPFVYKINPGLPQIKAKMPDLGSMYQYHLDRYQQDGLAENEYSDEVVKNTQFLKSVDGVTSFETWLSQNTMAVLPH